MIAIVDYGMGTAVRWRRRSSSSALGPCSAWRPRRPARRGRVDRPRGRGVSAAINLAGLGLDELPSVRPRASRCSESAWECSCCSTPRSSSAEPTARLLPGRVAALPADGLKVPHIGWNLVRFERSSPLTDGLPGESAPSTTSTRSPRCPPSRDVLAAASGAPFVSVAAAARCSACSSTPRSPRATGCGCWRTSPRFSARGRVILYPVSAVPSRP